MRVDLIFFKSTGPLSISLWPINNFMDRVSTMRMLFLLFQISMFLICITSSNAIAQESRPSNAAPAKLAVEADSHKHFNTQVQKLNGAGLVFAAPYSTALKANGAPTKYPGWIEGSVQEQIDRDYFEFQDAVPNAIHDSINDGAEFRWQDDYQKAPPKESGSDGGQIRPSVKGLVRKGKLAKPISDGELWFQYEVWFEKGMSEFGAANNWTSQKTARVEDGTVRPHKKNHWTITLRFKNGKNAEWMLRGYNRERDPRFAKPLQEGRWQRITVRTYDLGTANSKVDVWHQNAGQKKADKMFAGELGNWSKDTVVGGIALMNNSSGHGGTPFSDHELSVLFRNWIVSRKPIDLGEDSFRN